MNITENTYLDKEFCSLSELSKRGIEDMPFVLYSNEGDELLRLSVEYTQTWGSAAFKSVEIEAYTTEYKLTDTDKEYLEILIVEMEDLFIHLVEEYIEDKKRV